MAAVELLIARVMWLRRQDFVDGLVNTVDSNTTTDDHAGDVGLAWVGWRVVVSALDAGGLLCSDHEGQLLWVAASLAEGVPVDLGAVVAGLDEVNIGLVAAAVVRANGRGDVTAGLGEREQR